ncbi:DUF202 domain-containing protein [Oenococcus sicerae]|uniref:DUF202 domain-containing protein n=1 Tax=Oenococcus sicerae TaxID=2203724 RepID=UPI0039EA791A
MVQKDFVQGYETEIKYQKHMIANLGRWFTLFSLITGIAIVLLYFFHINHSLISVAAIALFVLGLLGMMLFGYGIYKGRQNVGKVIDAFENKLAAKNAH